MNDLFENISEDLRSKIVIVSDLRDFDVSMINNGLICIHLSWSGYSFQHGKVILNLIDQLTLASFPIYIFDNIDTNGNDNWEWLGFLPQGYFECVWIENGVIKYIYRDNNKSTALNKFKNYLLNKMILELIKSGDLQGLKEIAREDIGKVKCNSIPEELASIHLAAGMGNLEIVQFLLESPVNEDPGLLRGNNFTPLHAAAMNGHTKVVEYLLDKGAGPNVQTIPQKYAPIHSASFGGHLETIKMLINKGARIDLQNYRDEYPIDTAKRQNQHEVINFFLNLKE